ncbi:MAG: choice-of-anchor Q domain-containing protein [Nitrospirales bacterium]
MLSLFPKKILFAALLVLISGFTISSPDIAHSTTYYVATTGNDSQACATATNSTTPRRTITMGMQCLSAGDVLEIKGGTYNEAVFNNAGNAFPDGTGPSNRTTIRGAQGETVIWTKSGGDHIFLMKNAGSYTRFENIRFDGSMLTITPTNTADAWKHFRQDSGTTVGLEFLNNHIYDAPNNGLFNGLHTSGWLIEGNTVYDNGRGTDPNIDPQANNLYIEGSNHIVRGNRVYYSSNPPGGNVGGIRVGNNAADNTGANYNIIENNYVSGGQTGIIFGTGDNNITRNNLVDNIESSSSNTGIHFWTQGTWSHNNNKIYNNTVHNAPKCIRISNSTIPINTDARNNILSNCTTTPIDDPNNILTVSNNLSGTDPLFVDVSSADYHLLSGSPAIDAGISLSDVPKDYDDNVRPIGNSYDIGAFEFTGSSSGSPTITTHPANATVTEPAAATFSVVATGTAPLSYQWRRGGTNISGATSASYTLTPTSNSLDNGAIFSVVVSNAQGSVTSNNATLTVNAPSYSFPAPLVTPTPSSTLTTTTVTFTGGHTSQDLEHSLRVGTTDGGAQIYSQSMGTNHSATVSGLPTTGTIYVWYWSRNSRVVGLFPSTPTL